MNYETYQMNLESLGFVRSTITKVSMDDWKIVEGLSSRYPLLHARYMRTHYRR